MKVWQKWQTAQQDLTKKREIKTRFELTGKTDKLPQAKLDCTEVGFWGSRLFLLFCWGVSVGEVFLFCSFLIVAHNLSKISVLESQIIERFEKSTVFY